MAQESGPELSVVIPLYNEEESLSALISRLTNSVALLDYEVLLIDDGSTDGTALSAAVICEQNARFKLIRLSRNFGHQAAINAGLRYATGRAVVVMDGDLQDPPEIIPEFLEAWKEGYQVVYGIRVGREEGYVLRCAYALFYRLLAYVSPIDIPVDCGDFSLMDRRVVDLLNDMPEQCRFIRGLRAWVGLRQKGIPFKRGARERGASKYSWAKLIGLAQDGIFSFSRLPLIILSRIGILLSLVSLLAIVSIIAIRLTTDWSIPGFAATATMLLFFGGVQLLAIGIVGEYVGRIFEEVKRRPSFVVASTVNIEHQHGGI